jgi:hypothetical protein
MYQGQHRALTHGWHDIAALDYSTFLQPHHFDWFVTFTFKSAIHPEAADKAFRVWVSKLNNHIYGRKWRSRAPGGVTWIRGLEWQKRGVIHYHLLVSGVRGAIPSRWGDVWHEDMGMGFAQVVPLKDDQQSVKSYVTKYVTKGGELDFSQNFVNDRTRDWITSIHRNREPGQ